MYEEESETCSGSPEGSERVPGTQEGRILVFTGDGKGKTTAALGMALRAHGHDIPVAVIQFVKSDAQTGEFAALKGMAGVEIVVAGLGFVPPKTDPCFADHRRAAEEGLRIASEEVCSGRFGLVILDELCYAVARDLVAEEPVLRLLKEAAPGVAIVLTGRGATEGLIAAADTVSEIRCVKHGFDSGKKAQKGVEF
ncbi:MAG: cob(I)yrinic acid a,c-diamide adenosyltransferase [Proteobacteria bacterium]|nr:cob(I)yrinic acid a,c-diamide adenosyltransferase [Pseudomonadota bacterium]MBU2227074.1 cob(I)yrinic acid a,c-diamide adenosyltransferase [Pseudomonadota bacterium]MBU2262280.1 cob(I)yrinic acid a,c-diamide adenosyltransferase [Pseudomonadota bacterium]